MPILIMYREPRIFSFLIMQRHIKMEIESNLKSFGFLLLLLLETGLSVDALVIQKEAKI